MKKVISVLLCIFIFAIPCFCFAVESDDLIPYYLPQSNTSNPIAGLKLNTGNSRYMYKISNNPVYVVFFYDDLSRINYVLFSESPNQRVYIYTTSTDQSTFMTLNQSHNGYYYTSSFGFDTDLMQVWDNPDNLSAVDIIDDVNQSFFSVTFSLSNIVSGGIAWLKSMVDTVTASGLLLWFVLFSFLGISIGLLQRFVRR